MLPAPLLRRLHGLPWWCAVVAAYPAWVILGFPWLDYLELNPDEGINLAKAALVAAGHPLYTEVWSDQPPVLTHLLAALQLIQPWEVPAARYLILASACLLLVSLFRLVEQRSGRAAALWATLLLATAPLFVRLSVSVMVGLPAVALALLAWSVAGQARLPRLVTAVITGVLFAISLQTKLFTMTLAPAIAATLWLGSGVAERRRAMAVFMGSCALSVLGIGLVTGATDLDQLIQPHISPELRPDYSLSQSAQTIWQVLSGQPVLLGFGALGAVLACRRFSREHLPAMLGLVVPGVLLLMHVPVWYHQVLLLLPALAWLGGIALARVIHSVRGHTPREGLVRTGAAALLVVGASGGWALTQAEPETDRGIKQTTSEALQRYAGLGGWVVTDSPLDAFRAGLLVPPELAVYSAKRIKVGQLPPSAVLGAIGSRRPRQVLFRRFPPDPGLVAYLDAHYLPSHRGERFSHHVRPDGPGDGISPDTVRPTLDRLLQEFAATAVRGGYAGIVSVDRLHRYGETTATVLGADSVYMRPPGSTARAGACFLDAYQATGKPQYRQWARETAQAMVRTQHCSGAWAWEATDRPACTNREAPADARITLDEGLIAESIEYLLDVHTLAAGDDAPLLSAARQALDFLVAAQNAHGAWPYDFSTKSYGRHSTINDDLTTSHIRALQRGWETWADPAYLLAVQKGVGFLLQTQLPQGGWAQQYDEALKPVGARSFEPAAAASIETAQVLRTLLELDQHHSDPRITVAIRRAVDWLKAAQISQGRWARFYDLDTGQPVYADRQGKRYSSVDALPRERRLGYRWEGAFAEVAQTLSWAQAHLSGDTKRTETLRRQIATLSRLGDQAQARELLEDSLKSGAPSLVDANGLIWTKTFVDRCRLLNALLTDPSDLTGNTLSPRRMGPGS